MTQPSNDAVSGRPPAGDPHSLVPFLIGTVVGGVAGAVVGTLLSGHTVHLITTIVDIADRRIGSEDPDRLKLELLLQ